MVHPRPFCHLAQAYSLLKGNPHFCDAITPLDLWAFFSAETKVQNQPNHTHAKTLATPTMAALNLHYYQAHFAALAQEHFRLTALPWQTRVGSCIMALTASSTPVRMLCVKGTGMGKTQTPLIKSRLALYFCVTISPLDL